MLFAVLEKRKLCYNFPGSPLWFHTGYTKLQYETEGLVIRKVIGINSYKILPEDMWAWEQPDNRQGDQMPTAKGAAVYLLTGVFGLDFRIPEYMMLNVITLPHRSFANM